MDLCLCLQVRVFMFHVFNKYFRDLLVLMTMSYSPVHTKNTNYYSNDIKIDFKLQITWGKFQKHCSILLGLTFQDCNQAKVEKYSR